LVWAVWHHLIIQKCQHIFLQITDASEWKTSLIYSWDTTFRSYLVIQHFWHSDISMGKILWSFMFCLFSFSAWIRLPLTNMQLHYAYGVKSWPMLIEAIIYFVPEYSLDVMITRRSSGRHMLQQPQHLHIWVQITNKN
jgi:hypothetical protein